jgi:hypothetical protein
MEAVSPSFARAIKKASCEPRSWNEVRKTPLSWEGQRRHWRAFAEGGSRRRANGRDEGGLALGGGGLRWLAAVDGLGRGLEDCTMVRGFCSGAVRERMVGLVHCAEWLTPCHLNGKGLVSRAYVLPANQKSTASKQFDVVIEQDSAGHG